MGMCVCVCVCIYLRPGLVWVCVCVCVCIPPGLVWTCVCMCMPGVGMCVYVYTSRPGVHGHVCVCVYKSERAATWTACSSYVF